VAVTTQNIGQALVSVCNKSRTRQALVIAYSNTIAYWLNERMLCAVHIMPRSDRNETAMGGTVLIAGRGADTKCKACPSGAECIREQMVALPGYWRQHMSEQRMYECLPNVCLGEREQLTLVLGANVVEGADNLAAAVDLYLGAEVSLNGTCKEGHSGRLCEVCMAGYTRQGGYCTLCESTPSDATQFLLTFVLALLIALVLAVRPAHLEAHPHGSCLHGNLWVYWRVRLSLLLDECVPPEICA
jgi:hypothetical protein